MFNIPSCSNLKYNYFFFSRSQYIVGKAIRVQTRTGPYFCRRLRLPEFLDIWHMKVARLSSLRTGRLYLQEILLVLIRVRG